MRKWFYRLPRDAVLWFQLGIYFLWITSYTAADCLINLKRDTFTIKCHLILLLTYWKWKHRFLFGCFVTLVSGHVSTQHYVFLIKAPSGTTLHRSLWENKFYNTDPNRNDPMSYWSFSYLPFKKKEETSVAKKGPLSPIMISEETQCT